MSKIIERAENNRKIAIDNLFKASEEYHREPHNIDTFNDKMNNTGMALHQIGINLETIQSEKDELIQALIKCAKVLDYYGMTGVVIIDESENPTINISDVIIDPLEKHTGKSIEELLK